MIKIFSIDFTLPYSTQPGVTSKRIPVFLCASEINDKGTVVTGKYETTHLPGLYVAGDASRAVQWVIVAAAEGAEAAFDINTALIKEDLR